VRQLQGDGTHGLQLIGDDFDKAAVGGIFLLQFWEFAGVEDQFPQECGHVHDETFRGKEADQAGSEVESAHGNGSGDGDGVRSIGRDPDGAQRRNDPDAVFGLHGHDAGGSEDELILGMRMLGDVVSADKVIGESGELSGLAAAAVEQEALTLMRHLLST